ncbi:MAG: Fe-S cluster assembly protein SufD [Bacteroidales bacterium]|nr:Fe-S cluster assembly protein SufD [Bacteroidales bacterium]
MDIQKTYENYLDIFQKVSPNFKKTDSDKIYQTRIKAYENFKKAGIPDHTHEDYKYAGIAEICDKEYEFTTDSRSALVDLNSFFRCEVEDMDTHVILLSNGEYYEQNEKLTDIDENIIICGLKEAKTKHAEIVNKYYNQHVGSSKDGFVNLNTMLSNDGLFIYIPKNAKLNKAIQLVNLTHGFGNKNIFKRNLIILEENTELNMVICDHTLNTSNNFVIDVTESFVGKNANFKYHALQNEPNKSGVINSHFIRLDEHANASTLALSLHGGIIRNNFFVQLAGRFSEANLYGLNLTDREQRVDNFSIIDHIVPDCTSNELFKGIIDEKGKGAFAGRIIVRPDAQRTLAYQSNKNLCLTPEAKMRTKPQLEIYADDVKCSHGATVGQLDETALFYLMQRGINKKEARLMLMFAFANDVLLKINIEPLRKRISGLINSRLRGEFSNCSHCLLNCNG